MLLRVGLLIAFALTATSGCGGSGSGSGGAPIGGPPPPPPPSEPETIGGIWTGAITWEPTPPFPGGALNVRALMTETGEFRWVVSEEAEVFGQHSEQIFGKLDAVEFGVQTGLNAAIWAAALRPDNP